jgi:hypothetical protein
MVHPIGMARKEYTKQETTKMANGAAAKKTPAPRAPQVKVRTNPFTVQTMTKIPESLLTGSGRRITYGWEELDKPKRFKEFPRAMINNARQSAYKYAEEHGIDLRVIPTTDEDGNKVLEKAWFTKDEKSGAWSKEITKAEFDDLPEDKRNEKMVPVSYRVIRIS